MLRTIRVLAVAGLVAIALSVWMASAPIIEVYVQPQIAVFVEQFAHETGILLGFAAGLLTLTLTVPQRQRPWSAALLVSLILNGYWPLVFYGFWWTFIPPLANGEMESPSFYYFIFWGLIPAAPALLALGYAIRAARRAPQATQSVEEQGSLDITIEPIRTLTGAESHSPTV